MTDEQGCLLCKWNQWVPLNEAYECVRAKPNHPDGCKHFEYQDKDSTLQD